MCVCVCVCARARVCVRARCTVIFFSKINARTALSPPTHTDHGLDSHCCVYRAMHVDFTQNFFCDKVWSASGPTTARFVVRRKPPGKLIRSAHQIDREYRVQNALQNTPVPVAKMHAYCSDEGVIGAPFYVPVEVQPQHPFAQHWQHCAAPSSYSLPCSAIPPPR